MAIYTHHPKGAKDCVFCKFWIGDAKMKFVNSVVGYASGTVRQHLLATPVPTMFPARKLKSCCDL